MPVAMKLRSLFPNKVNGCGLPCTFTPINENSVTLNYYPPQFEGKDVEKELPLFHAELARIKDDWFVVSLRIDSEWRTEILKPNRDRVRQIKEADNSAYCFDENSP